jgi:hypothetical protein
MVPGPFSESLPRRAGQGNEPETGQSPSALYIVGPAVCTLLITLTCTVLLYALHIDTYGNAVRFALLVGLGYLVTNTVNIAINPNIPRPFFYGLITGSYHLVGTLLASLLLVALK